MAVIHIPRRTYSQPQGRVEIATEWVRDIRSELFLPSSIISELDDKNFGPWGGTYGRSVSTTGPVITFSGGQRLRKRIDAGTSNTVSPPLVLVAVCTTESSATGERYAASVGPWSALTPLCRLGQNGTSLRAQFRNSSSQLRTVDVAGGVQVGKNTTLVARFDHGGGDLLFCQDGRIIGSGLMPATTTMSSELYGVGTGRPADGIQQWIGSVAMAGFLIGEYSDEEVQDLSSNPWQLFRSQPRRIYTFPSGPIALPTLSGASFAGRVPSVTLTY